MRERPVRARGVSACSAGRSASGVGQASRRSVGQASEILVGIAVWHLSRATLQTRTSRRCIAAEPSERPSTVCGGGRSLTRSATL